MKAIMMVAALFGFLGAAVLSAATADGKAEDGGMNDVIIQDSGGVLEWRSDQAQTVRQPQPNWQEIDPPVVVNFNMWHWSPCCTCEYSDGLVAECEEYDDGWGCAPREPKYQEDLEECVQLL